jgi:hypothetical protein
MGLAPRNFHIVAPIFQLALWILKKKRKYQFLGQSFQERLFSFLKIFQKRNSRPAFQPEGKVKQYTAI